MTTTGNDNSAYKYVNSNTTTTTTSRNRQQQQQHQGLDGGSVHSMGSVSFGGCDDERDEEDLDEGYDQHDTTVEDESFRIIPSSSRHSHAGAGGGGGGGNGRSHSSSNVYLPRLQSLAHRSHPLQFAKQTLRQGNPSEPPPPTADATVCHPDSPQQIQVAQQAGKAARERFDRLVSSSHLPGDHASNLLLLSWDEVFVEDLLGVGGFACVCLVTCDTLWRKHKRQYLQRKWNQSGNSGDLDSLDSSLLPPSEDSWMSMSVETNEEKYYACKCLSNSTIKSKDPTHFANAAADLVGEAFLLSKLSHPNIIRLYGVTGGQVDQAFQSTGGFFLVMEALTSVLDDMIQVWRKDSVSSVGDFLRKSNESVPNMEERLTIGMEIAKGMQYLHQNRVIFRDLKPGNVGIDREGGVRCFDFGLARECPSGVCSGKAGSFRYMAPETIRNKFCCFASDVYAFGITLWELLSLVRPTKWDSPEEIEEAVCDHGYRPDTTCIEDPAVRELMEACWNEDYQQRPTFDRITSSIQNILDSNRRQKRIDRRSRRNPSRHNSGLDGASNHSLSRDSGHSLGSFAVFEASFQSLMNESVMTDASFSKMSALTMGSGRNGRQNKRGGVHSMQDASMPVPPPPPPPPMMSPMCDAVMSPPPPRIPARPPKTPKQAPPAKNESETTVTMSNVSDYLSARKSVKNKIRDVENDVASSAVPIGHPKKIQPKLPPTMYSNESVGRRGPVTGAATADTPDYVHISPTGKMFPQTVPQPPTKRDSISTTSSAPASIRSSESPKVSDKKRDFDFHIGGIGYTEAEASSSHSRTSMGSNTSGTSTGSGNGAIQWQRKKKPGRKSKELTSRQSPRSKSEPLSNLIDVMSRK
jgi:serine/threonine protein kinase